jgi:hypothetical protein
MTDNIIEYWCRESVGHVNGVYTALPFGDVMLLLPSRLLIYGVVTITSRRDFVGICAWRAICIATEKRRSLD